MDNNSLLAVKRVNGTKFRLALDIIRLKLCSSAVEKEGALLQYKAQFHYGGRLCQRQMPHHHHYPLHHIDTYLVVLDIYTMAL